MKKMQETRVRYDFSPSESYDYNGSLVSALNVNVYGDGTWGAVMTLHDYATVTAYTESDLAKWPGWAQALVREHVPVPEVPPLECYQGPVMFVTAFDGKALAEPVLYFRDPEGDWVAGDDNFPDMLRHGRVYDHDGYRWATDWRPAKITMGEHSPN